MDFRIRMMKSSEYPLLTEFLYLAIFIPDGEQPPSVSIIDLPELQVYVEDFGKKKDDICFLAEADGEVIGAVWAREMADYGHIEDGVPSCAISLHKEFRGRGIGTALMKKLLLELAERGYEKTSLSVQKMNPAVRLYYRVGYRVVSETEQEYLMLCYLNGLSFS